jgi:glucose-6-phosphate 1-dehydrogenase
MGRKRNQGHTHSAGIIDGNYTAGITGNLDQGYNDGPGSWSQSNILTYANGKRAIQTTWGNAWRA